MKLKSNQTLSDRSSSNLTSFFACFELKKYLSDFQNRNFSFLRLKWTQIMEIIPNQTFFHGTYSNLTPYIFFIKKHWSNSMTSRIKIFQFYDWSKFKQWKWNQIGHFSKNILKPDIIFCWSQDTKSFQRLL